MAKTIVKNTQKFIVRILLFAVMATCIVSVLLSYGLFTVLNH